MGLSHMGVFLMNDFSFIASNFQRSDKLSMTSSQNLFDVISLSLFKMSGPYVNTSHNSKLFGKIVHLLVEC